MSNLQAERKDREHGGQITTELYFIEFAESGGWVGHHVLTNANEKKHATFGFEECLK